MNIVERYIINPLVKIFEKSFERTAEKWNEENKSGIYNIQCLVSNNYYIGHTHDFDEREGDHFSSLRSNRHPNPHLQNAFNLYGEGAFVFKKEEYTILDKKVFVEREQFWADYYGFDNIYNIREIVESNLGIKLREETKNRISLSKKGKRVSIETEFKKGIIPWNKGLKGVTGTPISNYTFISPEDVTFSGIGVNKFARDNNLNEVILGRLHRGEIPHYKGWRLPENKDYDWKLKEKEFIIRSPEGKVFKGTNISKFAKSIGLSECCIGTVISGKNKQCKGWHLPENKGKIELNNTAQPSNFRFLSPEGVLHEGTNIKEFAKTIGVKYTGLYKLVGGHIKSHFGWTLYKE